jgi:hypothetical protein
MDYTKVCPKLSKHIPEETIQEDTTKPESTEATKPIMTKGKVEEAYKYIKSQQGGKAEGDEAYVGKGDGQIASLVGLTEGQVQELKKEFQAYASWTEPVEATK